MIKPKAAAILSYLQVHQCESCSLLYKTCLFCKAFKWWSVKDKPYCSGLSSLQKDPHLSEQNELGLFC